MPHPRWFDVVVPPETVMASQRLRLIVVAFGLSTVLGTAAHAQDRRLVPPGWSIGRVKIERWSAHPTPRVERTALAPSQRELTVRRRFEEAPTDEDDPLFDGATHYNNIRLFNPVPSVDSGTQFPYGLDGIGGYGSDLGLTAAQDARIYDRGQ